MMELKKDKVYSVKDCSDLLDLNEQTTRRYIDDFKLGTREKSSNNVERRILSEKDFDKLSEIVGLKEKGFTPKTIGLILSADLAVVSKDHLQKIENKMQSSFEQYGLEYLKMQERLESLELENQKQIEYVQKENEKDEKIKELTEIVNKLDEKVNSLKEQKDQPEITKKSIWKKIFG